jgi:hypothetical protein
MSPCFDYKHQKIPHMCILGKIILYPYTQSPPLSILVQTKKAPSTAVTAKGPTLFGRLLLIYLFL